MDRAAQPRYIDGMVTTKQAKGWLPASCVVLAVLVGAAFGGCGSDDVAGGPGTTTTAAGGSGLHTSAGGEGGSGFDAGVSDARQCTVEPATPVITVVTGQPLPTVQFEAVCNGTPEPAQWLCSRGEIGSIDENGVFTPTGDVAGEAVIEATVGEAKPQATITVEIETVQNGASGTEPPPSSGGWGGVGGEGVGPAVDSATRSLLQGATSSDPGLGWLYPYDETVWPLGLLPPLLQWSASTAEVADAVYLHLSSEHYDYQGFFGRPAPLASGAPFVRHPIPPDAWRAATLSSAGGTLTAQIVVAAGGTAYGPIAQSWTIARGVLKGTVYYQSYGTHLAHNYCCYQGTAELFGGATLTIEPGSPEPELVAGADGDSTACRVCHSVASGGSRMVVQHGNDYSMSSSYDLQNGYTETAYAGTTDGNLGWVGMTHDGSKGLGNRAPIPGGANPDGPQSQLYDMATGSVIATTGLSDFVTRAGFPAFSIDGAHVAFNFYGGAGDGTIGAGDGTKLVAMDFDGTSNGFSNPRLLYQGTNHPGWPSFLPTNDAVVFQVELPGSTEYFGTRNGGRGELWWADLGTGTATPLERLNGKDGGQSYLPVGPGNHADDTVLNYEPTVSPIPSGGYAWVVFMSRRTYGNVATIDPWRSDPRYHDILDNVTPKKLWVAAVELNAAPGSDPSHPAFYLPGQELMAGNSRGYWVNTPCKPDGDPCDTGDECCGGYCQPDPVTEELVCGQNSNECSEEFEACTSDADCCDAFLECVNGMCVRVTPN